jgi:hypothetical protein
VEVCPAEGDERRARPLLSEPASVAHSIWKVERSVPLAAADVSATERIVRLRGRRYRWQEITPAEVLRLLEKPGGTIPIHRLAPVPDRKSLEDLIAAFRGRS